jgi:hypothetical protein
MRFLISLICAKQVYFGKDRELLKIVFFLQNPLTQSSRAETTVQEAALQRIRFMYSQFPFWGIFFSYFWCSIFAVCEGSNLTSREGGGQQ